LKKLIPPTGIGQGLDLRSKSVGTGQDILAGIPLGSHLNHLPRAVVGARGEGYSQDE